MLQFTDGENGEYTLDRDGSDFIIHHDPEEGRLLTLVMSSEAAAILASSILRQLAEPHRATVLKFIPSSPVSGRVQ